MKIIFHEGFYQSYTYDPAAEIGRMEAIVNIIKDKYEFVEAVPAEPEDIAEVHSKFHIDEVRRMGLYDIAALSAGGAIQAAQIGMEEPAFALIRPPGHHASAESAWGFCFFNNMAIAIRKLRKEGLIKNALILDFDLHFGDGTVNILGTSSYVEICNPSTSNASEYLKVLDGALARKKVDVIGISAGFDNAKEDWGGLLSGSDYTEIGRMVRETAEKNESGRFAILEGGYNHSVLGQNALAFLQGFE